MSRKKIAILGCIGVMAVIACFPVKVTARDVKICAESEGNIASPRSIQYVWHYKKENGRKYRRLWDGTNQKWVTDWILCP